MNLFLRSNPYVADLLCQPQALEDTLHSFTPSSFKQLASYPQQLRSGVLHSVVLTGMGSSFHALLPLYLTLLRQGIPAVWIETSELIHHTPQLINPSNLFVVVSQSGRSAEILGLVEYAGKDIQLIGITNSEESPLAARANALLVTHAGQERTVSCKTYVTSLAVLAVLAGIFQFDIPNTIISNLQALPPLISKYFSDLDEHVESLQQMMEGLKTLFLTGRGVSLAAAATGALIIKEAAHFHAEGISCAAFRHGPLEMVNPGTFVVIYEGLGPTRAFNRALAVDILEAGGHSVLVGSSAEERVFNIPPVPEVILPIIEILPAQMLSVALACMQGLEPGVFTRAQKVTSIE